MLHVVCTDPVVRTQVMKGEDSCSGSVLYASPSSPPPPEPDRVHPCVAYAAHSSQTTPDTVTCIAYGVVPQ